MILNVHVSSRLVTKLYRSRDEYVLKYLPGTAPEDFVSLAMPVREEPISLRACLGRSAKSWGVSATVDSKNR